MSSEIQVFDNDRFGSVRALSVDGEPWFVATDVAKALGYRMASDMTRVLFDDEKGTQIVRTPGGEQELSAITEAGFYHAVMQRRSACVKNETARANVEAFQRWVTHEVLPAVRRDGAYVYSNGTEDDATLMARALLAAQRTIERNQRELEELRPKALFADAVAASDGTCLIGELAKMMRQNGVNIGQNRLFEWMRENGYLGKSGSNRNVPTQRAMEMGLFRIKETAVTHSDGHVTINRTAKVMPKGQIYFMNKFLGGAA